MNVSILLLKCASCAQIFHSTELKESNVYEMYMVLQVLHVRSCVIVTLVAECYVVILYRKQR